MSTLMANATGCWPATHEMYDRQSVLVDAAVAVHRENRRRDEPFQVHTQNQTMMQRSADRNVATPGGMASACHGRAAATSASMALDGARYLGHDLRPSKLALPRQLSRRAVR